MRQYQTPQREWSVVYEQTESPCTGAQTAARMHIGWNLGNTLDSFAPDKGLAAETAWFNPPVTRQVLQAVADAGFDVIRIPVTWSGHFGAAPDTSWRRHGWSGWSR